MKRSQDNSQRVNVEITYVEMLDSNELVPAPETEMVVTEAEVPLPELNRFLYYAVGSRWLWTERRDWSYATWKAYLENPDLHTWIGYVRGTPAGYYELERQGSDVEIRSFGLLPQFVGRGLGGDLLTHAVRSAWSLAATRIWLHTCSLDSPRGLKNYLARGFQIYKTESIVEDQPIETPEPW